MKKESEKLPSGKSVIRTFDEDEQIIKETHSYGPLKIACSIEYLNGKSISETYFVNRRLVGRKRYEKARGKYVDMPEADQSLEDNGAEMVKLIGLERKQMAAARKRRKENPPSDEQLRELERLIPFFQAASGDDIEALQNFLDAGEDPNAVSINFGTIPLYNACYGGELSPEKSFSAVRLLLSYGADPNKRFDLESPITGQLDHDLTALMVAPTAEVAKAMLDHGAEVNAVDRKGITPLMRAARSGRPDVIKVLLERGADAKLTSNDECSALDFAHSKLKFMLDNIEGYGQEIAEQLIASYREAIRLCES